jgi:hypothetical protein
MLVPHAFVGYPGVQKYQGTPRPVLLTDQFGPINFDLK